MHRKFFETASRKSSALRHRHLHKIIVCIANIKSIRCTGIVAHFTDLSNSAFLAKLTHVQLWNNYAQPRCLNCFGTRFSPEVEKCHCETMKRTWHCKRNHVENAQNAHQGAQ